MGREVRRVPKDWQHPRNEGQYSDGSPRWKGLMEGFADALREWNEAVAKLGLQGAIEEIGGPPDARDYMPAWSPEEATHFMMYETVSEGTPISPAFDSPEKLARWLADNRANAGAGSTATYEQWLRVCQGGWAPSAVLVGGRLTSGVEGLTK